MSAQKIYCSQCHKSAFCDLQANGRKYRKLYCHHHKCFVPLHALIDGCPYVIYENRDLYLNGVWKPASYTLSKA